MKKLLLILLICQLISGMVWLPCWGASYYVANAGSDSANGTTTSTPWAHIPGTSACSNTCASTTLNPGDFVYLNQGDSWTGTTMTIPVAGSSGNYITLSSYGSGAQPIIQGATNNPAIQFTSSTGYWTFNNLNLKATGTISGWTTFSAALYANYWVNSMPGSIPGIIVQNCSLTAAAVLSGPGTTVQNCVFNGTGNATANLGAVTLWGPYATGGLITQNTISNWGDRGVHLQTNADNNTISYNTIHDIGGGNGGIAMGIDCDGAASTGYITGTQIHHNKIYNITPSGMAIQHENSFSSNNYDNFIHDTAYAAIVFIHYSSPTDYRSTADNGVVSYNVIYNPVWCFDVTDAGYVTVENNTCYAGTTGTSGWVNNSSSSTYSTHETLTNNIISGNFSSPVNVYDATNIWTQFDYNDIVPSGGYTIVWERGPSTAVNLGTLQGNGLMTHGIITDPLFVSTTTPNFYLQSGSAAIWTGLNLSLTTDYQGNQVHNPPSIGAYEYLQGISGGGALQGGTLHGGTTVY